MYIYYISEIHSTFAINIRSNVQLLHLQLKIFFIL